MTPVEWLDRWFRDNPEATHEEGNKALEQAKQMEAEQRKELSDEEIEKAIHKIYGRDNEDFWSGAEWYREQLKQRQKTM